MTNSPQHEHHGAPGYESTAEGLAAALEDTIARNIDAVIHTKAAYGDKYGMTGGDSLTLFPDPNNPRRTITIAPVGSNAEVRRFAANQELHVTYNGKGANASGTYRIGGAPGNRHIIEWNAHSEVSGAIEASLPESTKFASLIEAITGASPEKPAGRSKQVLHALGKLSRRGSNANETSA